MLNTITLSQTPKLYTFLKSTYWVLKNDVISYFKIFTIFILFSFENIKKIFQILRCFEYWRKFIVEISYSLQITLTIVIYVIARSTSSICSATSTFARSRTKASSVATSRSRWSCCPSSRSCHCSVTSWHWSPLTFSALAAKSLRQLAMTLISGLCQCRAKCFRCRFWETLLR